MPYHRKLITLKFKGTKMDPAIAAVFPTEFAGKTFFKCAWNGQEICTHTGYMKLKMNDPTQYHLADAMAPEMEFVESERGVATFGIDEESLNRLHNAIKALRDILYPTPTPTS